MQATKQATEYPHLKRWQRAENYWGDDYYDYYVIAVQHRDSGALDRSNFAVLHDTLDKLATEAEENGTWTADASAVQIARASHWVVGWIDTLLLHTEAPAYMLEQAERLLYGLTQYPVVDEEHYSNLEYEETAEFWDGEPLHGKMQLIAEFNSRRQEWQEPVPFHAARHGADHICRHYDHLWEYLRVD